ncbi:hypothetical protein ACFFX0_22150 [Citricoccus parietis]|uniref:Uncharacterized protein n=1 Tax=Citricoccus parietis TaxID=592307 RepID=A0ABV5G491_9MICC
MGGQDAGGERGEEQQPREHPGDPHGDRDPSPGRGRTAPARRGGGRRRPGRVRRGGHPTGGAGVGCGLGLGGHAASFRRGSTRM